MTVADVERLPRPTSRRIRMSRGLLTVLIALVALAIASLIFAPSSMSSGALQGMLPFAAVLAIASLGQTLVVQQGGFDLSIAGSISLTIVICTHEAHGNSSEFPKVLVMSLAFALVAGLLNGLLIGRLGINPIVATLGMNALLYAVVIAISGGTPRRTTDIQAKIFGGSALGSIPNSVFFAIAAVAITTVAMKLTVSGRRFEAVGANPIAARATGLRVRTHRTSAYVWAQVLYWLAGVTLAGNVALPSAFQGDSYLLPSVAAVVLGGTSLLGGRGYLVSSALAALFLTQLGQFVVTLGVSFAVQTIVQAAALAIGVALYTVNWSALWRHLKPAPAAAAVSS
jgi:ribose transport system permease protein